MAAATTSNRPSELSILVDINDLPEHTKAQLLDHTPIGPDTFQLYPCTTSATIVFG